MLRPCETTLKKICPNEIQENINEAFDIAWCGRLVVWSCSIYTYRKRMQVVLSYFNFGEAFFRINLDSCAYDHCVDDEYFDLVEIDKHKQQR